MKPTNFKLSNITLQRPPNMTEKECGELPIYTNGEQCISCWKGTFWDRLKFLFSGRVWIGVISGQTQPPIYAVVSYPFIGDGQK